MISIHALREEGDVLEFGQILRCLGISIHALREEGDFWSSARFCGASVFLSTPSARRATPQVTAPTGGWAISIHALREEGDSSR